MHKQKKANKINVFTNKETSLFKLKAPFLLVFLTLCQKMKLERSKPDDAGQDRKSVALPLVQQQAEV